MAPAGRRGGRIDRRDRWEHRRPGRAASHRRGQQAGPGGQASPSGAAGPGQTPGSSRGRQAQQSGAGGAGQGGQPTGQSPAGRGASDSTSQLEGRVEADPAHVEPKSKLRETFEHSLDALTEGEYALDNRKQRILAIVGLIAAVGGLVVFGYMIVVHKPAISDKHKQKKLPKGAAAGSEPKPSVEMTKLALKTKPKGAHVVVNGMGVDQKTPGEVSVVSGKKNEIYLYKKGYVPRRQVLMGEAGAAPEEIELTEVPDEGASGPVKITSKPPGASVVLDGRSVGETPVEVEKIALEGRHHVELTKEGYHPYYGLFEMRKEGTTPVEATMAKIHGDADNYCEVIYDVVPQGAMIQVNGEPQGASNVSVRHDCSQYLAVSSWRSNYRDGQYYLFLGSPGKYLLRAELEKIIRAKGTVEIEVPDSLRVYVGSNAYGKGSVEGLELPEGEHTVVFETDERDRFEETLQVRPGTTTNYRAKFSDGELLLERVAQ